MFVALIENNTFVRWVTLKKEYPNRIWPRPILAQHLPENMVFVTLADKPAVDVFEKAVLQDTAVFENDTWVRPWSVVPMSEDEIELKKNVILANVINEVQSRLDNFAKTRGYDNILSLATYATSPVAKFATEGQAGVNIRDMTWIKLYEILDEINAGTRPMVTQLAEIEAELPPLVWPA